MELRKFHTGKNLTFDLRGEITGQLDLSVEVIFHLINFYNDVSENC